ncbi:hypothetical protein AN6404.2 [Aspergillus nidulans FGSC A4]|uniref:RING-type domain-containing protein n=1 Tax=Emericella nidulans (strain FGSC A4 / ATCC 38163 / CBS 112.46 / NRRL 194 / M139) TaxID=227321 RepID=Q5AZ76_EMENI|nr:hypothetical protein [Aspergillus nidulans FGSC A4]EAA58426.1 hypothetical protein AN6404.2 [Aspergillus nidulans FGSC A4]CBF69536.1 TPA: conserved hypothetical protein [Aspergillus nidulans FGSC A4]|eukprot:XP_664008.1 hypothetical protein AN6404.2 [Aspergillus nidulans FGSC A4]
MPYTFSYLQFPSAPHLSEIISLYPENEPFCVGYAPSQGRRCRMRTNASNRASAMAMLELGTKKVHMGQMPTRDILIYLASCTLCTRFHQGQAEGLAERWRQDIGRFLDYEYARPGLQELAGLQNRAYKLLADYQRALEQEQWRHVPTPRSTPATPTVYLRTQPTSSLSAYSRSDSIASTRNNVPGDAYSTATPQPASTSTSSSTSRNAGQRRVETRSRISVTETTAREVDSRALHSVSAIEDATNRPGSSTRRSSGATRDMGTREAVGMTRAIAHRTARTTTTSTVRTRPVADNLRSTSNHTFESVLLSRLQSSAIHTEPSTASTGATLRTATRRAIEGDCGICLEPLRESRDGRSSSSRSESENNGYAATAGGEASGPVRSTAAQDSYGGNDRKHAELTWCKTHCGVNYHAICISTWLATARNPTCPTCRGVWVNDHLET